MPLFLITCVCDEGVSSTSFRVVEAESRLAVAECMVLDCGPWWEFLSRSRLIRPVHDRQWTAERLLREIDSCNLDGDSCYQLRIHEIKQIEPCHPEEYLRRKRSWSGQ